MTECAATDLSSFNSMSSLFSLPYLWESGEQAIISILDPAASAVLNAYADNHGFKVIVLTNL